MCFQQKYGASNIIATAQMKFASEARPSQSIVPFGNTEPTCMPISGHFMPSVPDGRDTNSVQLIMPHGDIGRFLVLIITLPLSSTKLV